MYEAQISNLPIFLIEVAAVLVAVFLAGFAARGLVRRLLRREAGEASPSVTNEHLAMSTIRHELRNVHENEFPMVLGQIDTLIDQSDQRWPRVQRNLNDLRSSIGSTYEEIRLLSLLASTIESRERQVIHVGALLNGIVTGLYPLAEPRGVTVKMIDVDRDDMLVAASVDALENAFRRVIENAIIYNRDGGEVIVEARPQPNVVQVRIANEGQQIPPGSEETVFQPQERPNLPGAPPGSGMGLYIARRVVGLHDGTISMTSPVPGTAEGAEFLIDLPRKKG